MNTERELQFLLSYARESCFDQDICRDLLRILWTAYCLHESLDAYSDSYRADLLKVWETVAEAEESTSDWEDFESFDAFMRRYLI